MVGRWLAVRYTLGNISESNNGSQINVAASSAGSDVEIVEAKMSSDESFVSSATKDELLDAHKDFGPDALRLLSCIEKPDLWKVCVVYPALPTYVKGQVALLGDAVSR